MHTQHFLRDNGKGLFMLTEYVPTIEKITPMFPLILTTGRILSQYNVGAQTRRTENVAWHAEDRLEIHPHDAEDRGLKTGDWVGIKSRAGETVLRALVSDRVQPGVVYTTFHFPESGANVITTDNSDWATNCPEYKVTAVQVTKVSQPSDGSRNTRRFQKSNWISLNREYIMTNDNAVMQSLASDLGWPSYQQSTVERWKGDQHSLQQDYIAEEVPISLIYNGYRMSSCWPPRLIWKNLLWVSVLQKALLRAARIVICAGL